MTNINIKSITNLPVAIVGISLGFISISTIWEGLGATFVRHFSVLFAVISVGLMLAKLLLDPKKVLNELKHPITGSLYFTITLVVMALANYLSKYSLETAKLVWLGAIMLHAVLFVTFLIFMLKDFQFEKIVPSWFVPFIGPGMATVTGKPMGFETLTKVLFYYALIWLLILLPVLIYRVKFYKPEIPPQAKMSLAIFAAPPSLCLAGYLEFFEPSKAMLSLLVPLAYLSTLYVYRLLPQFLKQPFTLGFAPLTFPLAIGVIATNKYIIYLTQLQSRWVELLTQVFFIQLIVATLVIGFVVYKTLELLVIYLGRKKLKLFSGLETK